jgi:hypothetical protein
MVKLAVKLPVKAMVIILTSVLCCACAFQPQVAQKQPYADSCEMQTKQLTLTDTNITDAIRCQGHSHDALICLMIQGIIAPVGSFIISGSIVVVNNSLHWLEYQGVCDTGFIAQKTDTFKKAIRNDDKKPPSTQTTTPPVTKPITPESPTTDH